MFASRYHSRIQVFAKQLLSRVEDGCDLLWESGGRGRAAESFPHSLLFLKSLLSQLPFLQRKCRNASGTPAGGSWGWE